MSFIELWKLKVAGRYDFCDNNAAFNQLNEFRKTD
jgi:hypothetical protein